MKTDELINIIAQDAAARLPSLAARTACALALGGLVAAALFAYSLGVRPDIANALLTWRFEAKVATMLIGFAAALWSTARLARPDADARTAVMALALPLLALAAAVGWELFSTPANTWLERAIGTNSRLCLASITGLAVAPLVTLLVALRAGAPRSPALAGAAAGLLAGALAATLYASHCPDDSPLFVVLWYVPGMALVTLAGAAAGNGVLRW
jgi:hypothetical protein